MSENDIIAAFRRFSRHRRNVETTSEVCALREMSPDEQYERVKQHILNTIESSVCSYQLIRNTCYLIYQIGHFPSLPEIYQTISLCTDPYCVDSNILYITKRLIIGHYINHFGEYPSCEDIVNVYSYYNLEDSLPSREQLQTYVENLRYIETDPDQYHMENRVLIGYNMKDLETYHWNSTTETRFGNGMCTICQCEMQDGESCVSLKCNHVFHSKDDCNLSEWFSSNTVCPLCRTDMRSETAPIELENSEYEYSSDSEHVSILGDDTEDSFDIEDGFDINEHHLSTEYEDIMSMIIQALGEYTDDTELSINISDSADITGSTGDHPGSTEDRSPQAHPGSTEDRSPQARPGSTEDRSPQAHPGSTEDRSPQARPGSTEDRSLPDQLPPVHPGSTEDQNVNINSVVEFYMLPNITNTVASLRMFINRYNMEG